MFGGGQRVALDLLDQLAREHFADGRLVLMGCQDEVLRDRSDFVLAYDGRYNNAFVLLATAYRLRGVLRLFSPDLICIYIKQFCNA